MNNHYYGVPCAICGQIHYLNCNQEQAVTVAKYIQARQTDRRSVPHIQDALSFLSADDREILISGICPKCWNEMFGMNEEEEVI